MKTSSRKRLLISSVAMLLVAMLALGTATFAWFTSSTVAKANGINVRTSKASKLQISKSDTNWGTLVDYDVDNKLLLPASSADGSAWFKADAAAADASTLKTGTIQSVTTDIASHVIKDQLNVRNAGEAAVANVKIKFSVPNNYLRVALVPAAEGGPDAALEGTFSDCVYDADGVAYPALTSTAGDSTSITPKTTYTVDLGTLNPEDVRYYNLYVWFEGQDAQCYDATAGAEVSDIEFTVTGDTVVS